LPYPYPVDNREVKVVVDAVVATKDAVDPSLFSADITLSEGLNPVITVIATDAVGNSESDSVENIFIDNRVVEILEEESTIAGRDYEKNVPVNDNTPTLVVKIRDPGYPDTGLGIYWENVEVDLLFENGDIVLDDLDNAKVWEPVGDTWTFENTIPAPGLADGTYILRVRANDNLTPLQEENLWFVIDTEIPATPSLIVSYPATRPDAPQVTRTLEITLSGSCEAFATVNVYTATEPEFIDTLATSVTDEDGDRLWSTSVTISAGVVTKISVSQVDLAGNEGAKLLYGYMLADAEPPTISDITINGEPVTELRTDKSSVVIAGKAVDDVSPYYGITVTVSFDGISRTVSLAEDGSFSLSVPLVEGPNIITLVATDEAGNVSPAISLSVERVVVPFATYAIILVIIALIVAAIAIFRPRRKSPF
jgi:hypothetical protein